MSSQITRNTAQLVTVTAFCLVVAYVITSSLVDRATDPARSLSDAARGLLNKDFAALKSEKILLEKEKVRFARLKLRQQATSLPYWTAVKQYGTLSVVAAVCLSALIVAGAHWRARSVCMLTVKDASIPVRHKDLSRLAPEVATGIVTAVQLEARAPEKAFALWARIAEVNSRQIAALVGRRGLQTAPQPAQAAIPEQAAAAQPLRVPTFGELLDTGDIAPGKPIIFGFDPNGHPHTGSWHDLFSAAVAGQSGSGKSNTLRSLLAQSLLSGQVGRVWIVDAHAGHAESLLTSLGPLAHAPGVQSADNTFDVLGIVQAVNSTIDARLTGRESSDRVAVLVADEVLQLARVPQFAALIKKMGTESRKTHVYGLFSSQSWLGSSTGGTEARDNLTSIISHRLKPRQAQTLLQDKRHVQMVRDLLPGQALYVPTRGPEHVLQVPWCAPSDMATVVNQLRTSQPALAPLARAQAEPEPENPNAEPENPNAEPENPNAEPENPNAEIDELILLSLDNEWRESGLSKNKFQAGLSEQTGLSESLIRLIMLHSRALTDDTRATLRTFMTRTDDNVSGL